MTHHNTQQDVQNVLIRSAEKNDPSDAGWVVNGAGLHVNYKVYTASYLARVM
jgi:hypothetical protein